MNAIFKRQGEVLLAFIKYPNTGTVIHESADALKIYETAADAIAAVVPESEHKFAIMDIDTLETRDVTEDMSDAWLDAQDTMIDDDGEMIVLPEFVDADRAEEIYLEEVQDADEWGKGSDYYYGVPARI